MEILNMKVMTCGGRTSAVTKALKATQGVEDVAVDPGKAQATIRFRTLEVRWLLRQRLNFRMHPACP